MLSNKANAVYIGYLFGYFSTANMVVNCRHDKLQLIYKAKNFYYYYKQPKACFHLLCKFCVVYKMFHVIKTMDLFV